MIYAFSNFRPETFQFIGKFVTERKCAKTSYLLCLVGKQFVKENSYHGLKPRKENASKMRQTINLVLSMTD